MPKTKTPEQDASKEMPHDRAKRILHISKYFPPHRGGMETVLRDQMNMQTRDEGLEVAAVVHSSERRLFDKVDIQPLGYRVRHAARWFTAVFAPIAPFFWWSVYREIKELDPDEIKIHMPNLSAFWLLFLPAARKRKWVVLWHSDVLPSKHSIGLRIFYKVYQPLERWLLTIADVIVATSQPYFETSKPLQRFAGKCVVMPLEIDSLRIPLEALQARQPQREDSEIVRVLCVGRLTYYKDLPTVIRAIAVTPNAQLRIVGSGSLMDSLVDLVTDLKIENQVKFMGDLDDKELWQQFSWCDIHCLASCERTEAFGISILEAGMFDKPSIVSNVSGSGIRCVAESTSPERFRVFPVGNYRVLSKIIKEVATPRSFFSDP